MFNQVVHCLWFICLAASLVTFGGAVVIGIGQPDQIGQNLFTAQVSILNNGQSVEFTKIAVGVSHTLAVSGSSPFLIRQRSNSPHTKTVFVSAVEMSLLQKPKFLDDLQVYGFGKNGFHQTKPGYGDFVVPAARSAPVGIPGGVVDVAAGFDFSVALTTTGKVYAWGNDGQGQSSGNSCPSAPCEVSSPLLVTFPSTIGMKSIAAGPKHSLALSHSGLVFGWGFNNFYELGSGSPGSTIPPSQIASSAIYTSITAGLRLSMAIDTNGNPWAWGMSTATCNAAGYMDPTRLNTGAFASEFIISVKAAQDVEAVTFITASGKLIVCGDNTRYQLGVPSMSVGPGTFVAIDVSSVFIDAAIGNGWGIAIKQYGGLNPERFVVTWGTNARGILGLSDATIAEAQNPTLIRKVGVLASQQLSRVYAVEQRAFLLSQTGSLIGWSTQDSSNVPAVGLTTLKTPWAIGSGTKFASAVPDLIGAGRFSVAVVKSPVAVHVWGSFLDSGVFLTPRSISTSSSIDKLSVGYDHAILMSSATGAVYGIGSNSRGQLGSDNSTLAHSGLTMQIIVTDTTITHICAGTRTSVFAKANGALYHFGEMAGSFSPVALAMTNVPGGTEWRSLHAGLRKFFALSKSGVVFGWGDNTEFSLGMTAAGPWVGVPQPIVISNGPCSNVNVTAIASGGNADAWVQNSTIDSPFTIFSLSGSRPALCGIGSNEYGQLLATVSATDWVPLETQQFTFTEVHAGAYHVLARASTTELFAWGFCSGSLCFTVPDCSFGCRFPVKLGSVGALANRVPLSITAGAASNYVVAELGITGKSRGIPISTRRLQISGTGFPSDRTQIRAVFNETSEVCRIFDATPTRFTCELSSIPENSTASFVVTNLVSEESTTATIGYTVAAPSVSDNFIRNYPMNTDYVEIIGTDLGNYSPLSSADDNDDIQVEVSLDFSGTSNGPYGCLVRYANNTKIQCQLYGPFPEYASLVVRVSRNQGPGDWTYIGSTTPVQRALDGNRKLIPYNVDHVVLRGNNFITTNERWLVDTSIRLFVSSISNPLATFECYPSLLEYNSVTCSVDSNSMNSSFVGENLIALASQNFAKINGGSPIAVGIISQAPELVSSLLPSIPSNARYLRFIVDHMINFDLSVPPAEIFARLDVCDVNYPCSYPTMHQPPDLQGTTQALLECTVFGPDGQQLPDNHTIPVGCNVAIQFTYNEARTNMLSLGKVAPSVFIDAASIPSDVAMNAQNVSIRGGGFGSPGTHTKVTDYNLQIDVYVVSATEMLLNYVYCPEDLLGTLLTVDITVGGAELKSVPIGRLRRRPILDRPEKRPEFYGAVTRMTVTGSHFAQSIADSGVRYSIMPGGENVHIPPDQLPVYDGSLVSVTETSMVFDIEEANIPDVNNRPFIRVQVLAYRGASEWQDIADFRGGVNSDVIGPAVGIALAILAVAVIIVLVILLVRKRRRDIKGSRVEVSEEMQGLFNIKSSELEIVSKLGEGSFGAVYLGKFRKRHVAIKKLAGSMLSSHVNDFFREASLMLSIPPHRNVVRIFGMCQEMNNFSLVMEFLPAGSLDSYVVAANQDGEPIPSRRLYRIVRGIARGMEHLASQNVVHRDLAARNVLLDANYEPRIADFGFSRIVGEEKAGVTSASVGPIKWMPPESIRDRAYSEKSDVWAFGVVIYEIVTGKEPFEGMDLIEVAMQIRDQQLTLAKYLPTNGIVQDYLVELMKMCWSQAPADRPSFREIGAWLESNAPSRDKKGADDYANDVIAEPPVANESSREPELETKRRKKRKEARGVTAAVSGGTNYTSVDL